MAHGRNPGYTPGNNWFTCDRCGHEFRVSHLKVEWNGLEVCDTGANGCYESRHSQDFLRVHPEKIVPDQIGTEDSTSTVADQTASDAIAASQAANPGQFTVPPGDNDNEL